MYPNNENIQMHTNTTARRGVSAFAPTTAGLSTQKASILPQAGLSNKSTQQQPQQRSAFAPVASRFNQQQRQPQQNVPAASIFQQAPTQHQLQQQQQQQRLAGWKQNTSIKQQHTAPELHKLPTTIQQQQIHPNDVSSKQSRHQYRETINEDETTDENVNDDDDDDDDEEDGLMQLPLPTVGYQVEQDTEDVKQSFYMNMQTVTGADNDAIEINSTPYDQDEGVVANLAEEFEEMSMKLNHHQTDFNDLTALSTYIDQISISSIPVNCFSIATPMENGDLCTSTPQQSAATKREIKQLRFTISTIRHQMLSSLHSNPQQILESTQQLIQHVLTYQSRKLQYSAEIFEPQHERRWTAADYMWRIAHQNRMSFETFCHGVHLLDRVLSLPRIIPSQQSNDLQLTSLVCLFLAYKMIEKRIAAAATIHGSIGSNKFSRDDIQRREQLILNALHFEIAPTSLYDMVYQLALLFASTRQRDNALNERTPTDDLSNKSGRFIRLRYMLQFLTYCTITSSHYLQYNPFALACAIMMTAIGTIQSDFSQIWPLSMAMLTGVLPEDVKDEIKFVTQTHRQVKTVMNSRNGYVSSSALETFGVEMAYHVSNFKVDYNDLLNRIDISHQIAEKFLTSNKINLAMLQRICGIQQTILRVGSILDQRTITRKGHKAKSTFQSPIRMNNSNIVNPAHMSPILKKEQELQSGQTASTTTTEYLVVLLVDANLPNALSVSNEGKPTINLQDGLNNSNKVCIKIWMSEDSILELVDGYETLDDYRALLLKKERDQMYAKKQLQNQCVLDNNQMVQLPSASFQSPNLHNNNNNNNNNSYTPSRVRRNAPIDTMALQFQFQSPKTNLHTRQQQQQQQQLQQYPSINTTKPMHQVQSVPAAPPAAATTVTDGKRMKKMKENQDGSPNSNCTIM